MQARDLGIGWDVLPSTDKLFRHKATEHHPLAGHTVWNPSTVASRKASNRNVLAWTGIAFQRGTVHNGVSTGNFRLQVWHMKWQLPRLAKTWRWNKLNGWPRDFRASLESLSEWRLVNVYVIGKSLTLRCWGSSVQPKLVAWISAMCTRSSPEWFVTGETGSSLYVTGLASSKCRQKYHLPVLPKWRWTVRSHCCTFGLWVLRF